MRYAVHIIATIAALGLCAAAAGADDDCTDGFVAIISTAHHYIETGTGDVYSYDPGDEVTVQHSFRPMGDVRICKHTTSMFGATSVTYTIQSMDTGLSVSTQYKCNARQRGC